MKFGNYPDIDLADLVDVTKAEDGNSYTLRFKDYYRTPRPEGSSMEIDAFTGIEVLEEWATFQFRKAYGVDENGNTV